VVEAQRRLGLPLYGLRGIRSAFVASTYVNRAEFATLIASRDIKSEFPGVRGFTFVERVRRENLQPFIDLQRRDGAPSFDVWSDGGGADLFVLKFAEPLEPNRLVIGFDAGSDPARRAAAEHAILTGEPIATGRVALKQLHPGQAAFVYILPIYKPGESLQTPEARMNALIGLICAPVVVGEALAGLTAAAEGTLDIDVYDGRDAKAENLLVRVDGETSRDADHHAGASIERPTYRDVRQISVGGRTWLLRIATTPKFAAGIDRSTPLLIGISGILLTGMLAAVIWSFGHSRARALALAREITRDLALAKDRAEAAAEMLRRTGEMARVGGWELDTQNQELTWSDEVYRIHEVEPGTRVEVASAINFYPPPGRERITQAVAEGIETGAPWDVELPLVTAKGRRLWVRAQGEAVRRDGAVIKLCGAFQDVTEYHLAREELARRAAEMEVLRNAAEAASRAKSEFLANMSHEIRTPLTAILGYSDLLRSDADLRRACPGRVQTLDTIHDAGQHLLTVINDILDLSKIEAGRMTVESIQTSLVSLLGEIDRYIRPRAGEKGVELDFRLSTPIPSNVLSDPTRLRQILMNLAGNAAKFTDAGRITLSVAVEKRGATKNLVIAVEDTGPGMTPEQAGKLFVAFSQGDATVTREHGGTGLGLIISRRLARLMGGDVHLAWSEAGRGSCFKLTLPLLVPAGSVDVISLGTATHSRSVDPQHAEPTLAGRILLAEDGRDNQLLISVYLKRAGAEVDLAEDGRVALEMIDRAEASGRPYDLLISDMQMPEIDGYTLATMLRERGTQIPIIALTAHAMAEDRKKCLDAGCDDYASKPIERSNFLQTCARWLGQSPNAGGSIAA
ncbi:MAG: CHASE domain-containing protein, partial [Burkholderiales bacterium]|nr:CHASE domain-containing protein [Phycisphaerae bacterium]